MTEKIKLTKEQAESLDYLNSSFDLAFEVIVHRHLNEGWNNIIGLKPLSELSLKDISTALLVGYEVETTPEDIIRNRWNSISDSLEVAKKLNDKESLYRCNGIKDGIEITLNALNIKIKGIND